MARKRRSEQIDLSQTHYYHVVSRCVRSLRLLHAEDDARKEWCLKYIQLLVETTAVQVAGYALMDNHLHLLLRVDEDLAEGWSAAEVTSRWLKLHPFRNGYFQPVEHTDEQFDRLAKQEEWVQATREKLCSISQFMKELKQRIAQAANREEGVTGAFWEGRYKVTPIRSENQLLATLAYIDLNPFAANLCKTPEQGRYTSLQARLDRDHPTPASEPAPGYASRTIPGTTAKQPIRPPNPSPPSDQPQRCKTTTPMRQSSAAWLIPLGSGAKQTTRQSSKKRMTHHVSDHPNHPHRPRHLFTGLMIQSYLKLVDNAARLMRDGKNHLDRKVEPILDRINLSPQVFQDRIMSLHTHWQPYLSISPLAT